MSWNPTAPNPCVPSRWQATCRYYVCYQFANDCTAGCPYCFADPDHRGFPRAWTYAEALAAWSNVRDRYGPCYLSLGGLEPLHEMPFVGALTALHPATVQTNLLFDERDLYDQVDPARIDLHPSFHPHLWGELPMASTFFAKLERLQAHGYRVTLVALIGWPPYLPYWGEWIARLRDLGIWPNPVPARMTKYQGLALPEGYTPDELEIIGRHCGSRFAADAAVKPLQIVSCAAGHATACIMPNGDVFRCAEYPASMGGANLYRDGTLNFLDAPTPCEETHCGCGNLHPYHITE